MHFDGRVYFYNEELNLMTMDDINDQDVLDQIVDELDAHMRYLEDNSLIQDLEPDMEAEAFGSELEDGPLFNFFSWRKRLRYVFPDRPGMCAVVKT